MRRTKETVKGARLTQDGNDFVVLNDFKGTGHNKAEGIDRLAGVVEQVAGGGMRHGEVHGEGPQATVRRQSEGGMLVEHFPVQMDADVRLHVFGAEVQHLRKNTK